MFTLDHLCYFLLGQLTLPVLAVALYFTWQCVIFYYPLVKEDACIACAVRLRDWRVGIHWEYITYRRKTFVLWIHPAPLLCIRFAYSYANASL